MVKSEQIKYTLLYVAIGVAIYYFFFHKSEAFTVPSASSQCAFVKNSNKEVKEISSAKCSNINNENNRNSINQRSECYTLAGQDITSELDMNSWCQLDKDDMDIIDAASKNIIDTETMGYDKSNYGFGNAL
jgi:hypothetical protein